jgi:hypothetical protein
MRRIMDKSGAVWRADEESRYGVGSLGPDDPPPQANVAVVVFESPNGQTVTADLGAGRLETIADDDLLKILEEAVADRERRRRGGSVNR